MKYIEVDKDKKDEVMQDLYKFMPVYVQRDGQIVKVIAQKNNIVYYVKEI